MESSPNHFLYTASTPSEADACAWAFTTPTKFEKYYYKFAVLEDHDVRARVLYASLCHSDSMTGRSKWGGCNYPCCPGHEVVGEVIAIGSKVTKVKIGDKVAWGPVRKTCGDCEYCKKQITNACVKIDLSEKWLYGLYFGGYSTHIQQPDDHCFKVPASLENKLEYVAPLMCAGLTTFVPLFDHAQKGMKIGIIGVGGLGHLGAQFASKMGLEVHAFSASEGKDEFFKKIGISKAINWRKEKLSNYAHQYDLLLNTIPVGLKKEDMEGLLGCIKPYGKFINVGLPDVKETIEFQHFSLVADSLTIVGSNVGGRIYTERMLEFCANNEIECKCEFYDWEDFPKALDKLENGRPLFRGVVDVGKESIKYKNK